MMQRANGHLSAGVITSRLCSQSAGIWGKDITPHDPLLVLLSSAHSLLNLASMTQSTVLVDEGVLSALFIGGVLGFWCVLQPFALVLHGADTRWEVSSA